MRRKPKRGTKPALRMGEHRSRIRLASAQMALISLIFVTPMATSSSGLLGRLPDLIAASYLLDDRFGIGGPGQGLWVVAYWRAYWHHSSAPIHSHVRLCK